MMVAMVALFVALGGSSYAATKLAKNSVTSKSIRKGAVTNTKIKARTIRGNRIRNNTLTGTQIDESKLATVPDAAKVGGLEPGNLITKTQLVQWNVASNRGDPPKTLAKFGPFTLTGRCEVNGANTDAFVDATTSTNDVVADSDFDFDVGETENVSNYTNFAANVRNETSDEAYFLDPTTGLSSLDGDGQPMGIWVGFPGADCRFVGSLPISLP